jgi:alginate O-acetyltransferase complex protein AlgI
MLFNSYEFLFLFLPITLVVYFLIAKYGQEAAIGWLVLASLFFYGWWNPVYLILIILSMAVNFGFGELLGHIYASKKTRTSRLWLTLGITFNLGLLGYFKYINFAVNNINSITGSNLSIEVIILPLAISFFTFQQIAYLMDSYKGITQEYKFSHYVIFVTFFPQLIAGPIVHHKDMLSQFMNPDAMHPRIENITIGLSIFAVGLFKKTVLADGIAQYATPIFDSASSGQVLTFFEAWGGALSYTFQLYFDFSGYSDMAIGAARMFGIKLPINFHSPYKATNIIEFWRRWHITLSCFLRDYLYIPLGGNQHGRFLRYRNLMITMLLGGLWHGAGWTFVIWGGLHGFYLIINHVWNYLTSQSQPVMPKSLAKLFGWLTTFIAVVIGWVFFRATNFEAALAMLQGMAGLNGIALPNAIATRLGDIWELLGKFGFTTYLGGGNQFVFTWLWIAILFPITLAMPNTQQIMSKFEPALHLHQPHEKNEIRFLVLEQILVWKPNMYWAVAIGVIAALAVLAMTGISEFLYFQF